MERFGFVRATHVLDGKGVYEPKLQIDKEAWDYGGLVCHMLVHDKPTHLDQIHKAAVMYYLNDDQYGLSDYLQEVPTKMEVALQLIVLIEAGLVEVKEMP